MKFLYGFLFVVFLYWFFIARTESPEPPVQSTPPPTIEVVIGRLMEFIQSGKGFDYESSSRDGSIIEYTNVVTRNEPHFKFKAIRVNRPDIETDQDLSTISLELVGASLVNEDRVAFGFDRLVLEMPIETILKLKQLASVDYDFSISRKFETFQLDTFLIKGAYFLDENCDLRLGSFEIDEVANLNIKRLNVERVGIACVSAEVTYQFNVPYIYIDDLSAGIYPELLAYHLHSAIQNLNETSSREDRKVSLFDTLFYFPKGYSAEQIRISDISANFDGVFVETSAVSMSTNVEGGGNRIVSSMTPLIATVNVGRPNVNPADRVLIFSPLKANVSVGRPNPYWSESVRELFELLKIEELKLRFRQEQHFDVENDRFWLPLDNNYVEVNDLAKFNIVLELEGMASILEEVQYMLAERKTAEGFDENIEDLVRSNLKFHELGIDFTDSGLIDHAFEVASREYGQPPALLRGTANLLLASFPKNNDLGLSSEEEESLAEISKVLSAALKTQGTLSARFNKDDSIYDLQDKERRRKMIFEDMTLEFVE